MDVKAVNQTPVQQLALKTLRAMGEPVSTESLYSTQLMRAALDRGEHDLHDCCPARLTQSIAEALEQVVARDRAALEALLVQSGEETSVDVDRLEEEQAPPRQVATAYLLGAYQEWLSWQPTDNE